MDQDARGLLRILPRVFEALGIDYLVGGSVASGIHGDTRATHDVDFVADIRPEQVGELIAQLGDAFYASDVAIREAIDAGGMFNVIHLDSMYKGDVYAVKSSAFDRSAWERRKVVAIRLDDETLDIVVATAEDMIVQKLRWYKMGGGVSDRQWGDVQGMLKVQMGRLDYAYIRHWAAELGLTDLLRRAMEDAGTDAAEWPAEPA